MVEERRNREARKRFESGSKNYGNSHPSSNLVCLESSMP
jgi:hypothetical protein